MGTLNNFKIDKSQLDWEKILHLQNTMTKFADEIGTGRKFMKHLQDKLKAGHSDWQGIDLAWAVAFLKPQYPVRHRVKLDQQELFNAR